MHKEDGKAKICEIKMTPFLLEMFPSPGMIRAPPAPLLLGEQCPSLNNSSLPKGHYRHEMSRAVMISSSPLMAHKTSQ